MTLHCYTLSLCVQVSSYCFWPQGLGGVQEEVYGRLRVCLKRVISHGGITERRLEVTETGGEGEEQRVVTLLQLSGWSLGELPSPPVVLSLVDLLSKTQRSSPSRHTVIMCRSHDPASCVLRHFANVCICSTVME